MPVGDAVSRCLNCGSSRCNCGPIPPVGDTIEAFHESLREIVDDRVRETFKKAAAIVRAKAEFYADVECMPSAAVPLYNFTEKALNEVADALEEAGGV